MTDKELWRQMEQLVSEKQSLERDMAFMLLLKMAYDKDMKLIMSCAYDPMMPGMARQGFMEVMGKRMMVCFTSKQRAKQAKYNMTWDVAKARDLMNNCQTAHCGRGKPHFDFGNNISPIVRYRHLPQTLIGMTVDCCSLV